MNIGLIGIGTVGGGTYRVLKENADEIFNKIGIEIKITHVADKNLKLAKDTVDKEIIIEEDAFALRSEERRVGKECRSRGSPYQ